MPPDMDAATGFRDDWRWSRGFTFVGFGLSCFNATYLTFFGPATDHTDRRIEQWLYLAGALALYYMGRAGMDAFSRRQSVVAYETTRMQITAQRKSDLDDAAG